MKKIIIIVVVGIVVVGIIVTGLVMASMQSDTNESASTSDTSDSKDKEKTSSGKKACDLLTLTDAKALIGDNAILLEGSGDANAATTADVTVDTCTYSADGATLGDTKQLLVQLHSGDSAQVKQAYDNYKKDYPGDALPAFGSTAYYATETKQVNVLKGDSWIFVGAGSMNGEGEVNKALTIKSAEVAVEKL